MDKIVLDENEKKRLLERFLRYVKVDTRSDEESRSSPSTGKQKDLARILVAELKELGCEDAVMNEWGYVFATVPSNIPEDDPAAGRVPTIGLLAHMDTYFGVTGKDVKPQVIESYKGGDIELPGVEGDALTVDDNPNLDKVKGNTVITTDGTTLLGADDKAGIAEIMTAVDWMRLHPDFRHGPVRIGFTTDEEVGRGTEHFDVDVFGAKYAYTLDGGDQGEIEDETFCADMAVVEVGGRDVHPGYAKNKMTNAIRVASAIVDRLPKDFLPETTEEREPYLHPFTIEGDVSKVTIKTLVRAFTEDEMREQEDNLRKVVKKVEADFPNARIHVVVQEQYRNMGFKLREDPRVLDYAMEAARRLGIEPIRKAIRGGTDGARLSFMGVLTPNLWAGGQNFHSKHEWVSLEWMASAAECALTLLEVWREKGV
ncbi:MAG: peptidase T [Deltaproteobacteria bacterium]|nr:peptidase T [Deltaproteobacteria bacterium]